MKTIATIKTEYRTIRVVEVKDADFSFVVEWSIARKAWLKVDAHTTKAGAMRCASAEFLKYAGAAA